MEQNKEGFYRLLLGLLVVITAMILFVKPLKQVKNLNINREEKMIVSAVNLKNRIDDYHKQNKRYPKNLATFKRFYDEDIDSLVEYEAGWDNYVIRTRFLIDSERLVMTKDGITKEKDEEQDLGGD